MNSVGRNVQYMHTKPFFYFLGTTLYPEHTWNIYLCGPWEKPKITWLIWNSNFIFEAHMRVHIDHTEFQNFKWHKFSYDVSIKSWNNHLFTNIEELILLNELVEFIKNTSYIYWVYRILQILIETLIIYKTSFMARYNLLVNPLLYST